MHYLFFVAACAFDKEEELDILEIVHDADQILDRCITHTWVREKQADAFPLTRFEPVPSGYFRGLMRGVLFGQAIEQVGSDVPSEWDEEPTVILVGPPGCFPSRMVKRLPHKTFSFVKSLKTVSEFAEFVLAQVVIDSYST